MTMLASLKNLWGYIADTALGNAICCHLMPSVMSSMFALLSMFAQNAMPAHACSMTHHTDNMIALQLWLP